MLLPTNQPPEQLAKAVQWLEKTDFEVKIVIAGTLRPRSKIMAGL